MNKQTVETYLEGFRRGDHAMVLSCLSENPVWDLPGAFHIEGKEAFDKEIEDPCFQGRPQITVTRMTEENDVVVAEGTVRTQKAEGDWINLVFCDVFKMRGGKIAHLTSYLMEVKEA